MFKMTMLANVVMTIKPLYIVNSLTWFWKPIEISWILQIDVFEYLKVVKIVVVQECWGWT
jgi:hypothetical protein